MSSTNKGLKPLVQLIILLCLLGSSVSARVQIGDPDLPVNTSLTARPRLLLNRTYLDQTLRPRMEDETRAWQVFQSYVDSRQPENEFETYPVQTMRSLAIAYQVTGDVQYADRAKIPLFLMVAGLESHPAMTSDETWDEDFVEWVTGVAIGYDWLYDTLRLDDRTALVNVLLRAVDILNDPTRDEGRVYIQSEDGTYRFSAYDHYGPRIVWAQTAVGIALLGDTELAVSQIDYARTLFNGWIVPALDDLHGGAWAEGPTYGYLATWAAVQTAAAFWMALGENYFDNSRWWYDRMPYDMFLHYPQTYQRESGTFWNYPSMFGDTIRFSEDAFYGRAQDMLLSTVYSGTEHAGWMNWFLAQEGESSPSLAGRMAVEEFLWREEDSSGIPIPWNSWFTLRSGHFFMRSGWTLEDGTLDPNATVITFSAGDHFATHQFFDQGNLMLWRAGEELLVRSGVHSGGFSDHDANYYGRTVAGNTILVCDLAESFNQIRPNDEREVWLNDCGQRTLNPNPASAINPYFRQANAAVYETGELLRVAQEGGMTYARASLTAAYNSADFTSADNQPKVREVLRELVYIRPGMLVIHDRVTPMEGPFIPSVMFHTQSEPVEDGDWLKIIQGDSVLYLAGIAPQNTHEIDTGYVVAGEEIPFTPNPYEDEAYGLYSIRFMPIEARVSHFFLTLLIAGDASADTPSGWQYIQGTGVRGAAWGDWLVIFDDDPGDISQAAFQADRANVLVTGLQPLGAYRLTLPDGTRDEVVADDAGTLYIFLETLGELRLQQQ